MIGIAALRRTARELWGASPALTSLGLLMVVLTGFDLVALVIDPRVVTGALAWWKPAKFAVSTAVYAFTLAWLLTLLPERRRLRRRAGGVVAAMLLLEIVVITTQAIRGIPSHFNIATVLDASLFGVMTLGIAAFTCASFAIVVALFRARFADPALGWMLRASLLVTLIGGNVTGGLMVMPTRDQLHGLRQTGHATTIGAHTVGAPDGGPGLPMVGWSTTHGDLRPPHFVALHAFQLLPLLFVLGRRAFSAPTMRQQRKLAIGLTAGYCLLLTWLIWQALLGHPLASLTLTRTMAPGRLFSACTALALCGWLLLVFAPKRAGLMAVAGVVMPALLSALYCVVLAVEWHSARGGFSSLEAVSQLFANRWLLLAGWVHYLAFDLFIGGWVARDAGRRGVSRWITVPCLGLTFLFGPAGLLAHLLLRTSLPPARPVTRVAA